MTPSTPRSSQAEGFAAAPQGNVNSGEAELTAAWVATFPIEVSQVDDRERRLRAGPGAASLPRAGTSEGRQFRRWLTQVLIAERLVTDEASRRGLTADGAPPLAELAGDRAALLGLGSVAAALLADSALARAVFLAVTEDVVISDEAIDRYHAANPELFTVAEHRVVRHLVRRDRPEADRTLLDGRPRRVLHRGELSTPVSDAVFAAEVGALVGPVRDPLGWHLFVIEHSEPGGLRSLAETGHEIAARLRLAARRRAFTAWLDRRNIDEVRLAAGYEHPGDPRQSDNTHRH